MSTKYVREYYRVPAYRGQRVVYDGQIGRITSADHRLRVLFDGEKHPAVIHPTEDGLIYLSASGHQIWPALKQEHECRHRCPACRMGLVSHLPCDPQCVLNNGPALLGVERTGAKP